MCPGLVKTIVVENEEIDDEQHQVNKYVCFLEVSFLKS